jgi:hypothetical protein
MSEFSKFLSDLLQKFGESVQLGMVGKIQSFNKQTMRAEVVPLLRKESPTGEVSQFPVLSSVPCAFLAAGNFFIRPVYQAGDLVWLTFATHSIFDSLKSNPALASDQIFGIQNACVVNGLLQTGGSIGGAMDDADGMAIGDPDFFLEFTDSGFTAHLDGNTVDFDANGITVNDTKDVKFMPQNRSARTDGFLTPLGPTIQRLPGIHP